MTSDVIAPARPAPQAPDVAATGARHAMEDIMRSLDSLVRAYVDLFNLRARERIVASIDDVFAEGFTYTDPHVSLRGTEALTAFILDARARLGEAKFTLAGSVDAHHDQARFQWHVGIEGSPKPLAVGFDVVRLEGGKIKHVYGFIDEGRSQAAAALARRYIEAWNEADSAARQRALAAVFVARCTYVDPLAAVHGVAELSSFIGAVRERFPGARFALGGRFEHHHDQARFDWTAHVPGRDEPVAAGLDVVVLEGDKLKDVHGFLDIAPPA